MKVILDRIRALLKPTRHLPFALLFGRFQKILSLNNQILERIGSMGDKLGGDYVFDRQYILSASQELAELVEALIDHLNVLAPGKYPDLRDVFRSIQGQIQGDLNGMGHVPLTDDVLPMAAITQDLSMAVGGKCATLAEIGTVLGLRIPEGFAVTTGAFRRFMAHNGLQEQLQEVAEALRLEAISEEQASQRLRQRIEAGQMPPNLEKAILKQRDALIAGPSGQGAVFAMRSSAIGEDGRHSFAGQFKSVLNLPGHALVAAYKAVLASTFAPSAIAYRRETGMDEEQVAMAVMCQRMVDATASGVLYSLDPRSSDRDTMMISATWGLGASVVAGHITADQFRVARATRHDRIREVIAEKKEGFYATAEAGMQRRPIPEPMQRIACLTPEQIQELTETALVIERYFKTPQDIEFAFDSQGRLTILQARSLSVYSRSNAATCDISEVLQESSVILSGQGMVAQKGICAGKVFRVDPDQDLERFPAGGILVTRFASPRFARVIRKAAGIVTDVGSPTGHMATIAREFRVPTIVDTGTATQLLTNGMEITVDADANKIYRGIVAELCYQELVEENIQDTEEYRLLRRVLKKISPLGLIDPSDKTFVPKACQTYHDITRFIHEKAVAELIDLNYYRHYDPGTIARRLKLQVPLDLILIDIGGGIAPGADHHEIGPDQIVSVPMRAFLDGLIGSGAWSLEPMSVDFRSFMSSLTRTAPSHLTTPQHVGRNLAVISAQYANISLRLGYHFNMIDFYACDNPNDNYAYFRFLGGVTDTARRSRRATFIARLLTNWDFSVNQQGDLVVARVKKLTLERMLEKIYFLGMLTAFTRQLDVKMVSDAHIDNYVAEFQRLPADGKMTEGLGGVTG
jgi:pyruvate,water dikinase